MRCANFISHHKGLLKQADYQLAQSVLARFPLPDLGAIDAQAVLDVVAHDKKNINGKLNFILLDAIGNGVISTDVHTDDIIASLSVVGV